MRFSIVMSYFFISLQNKLPMHNPVYNIAEEQSTQAEKCTSAPPATGFGTVEEEALML